MNTTQKDIEIAEQIVQWVRSQDGKKVIEEGLKRTETHIFEFSKAREVQIEKLDECITR